MTLQYRAVEGMPHSDRANSPRLSCRRSQCLVPMQLWSGKYDRAMVGFLACLREFGQAALAEDAAAGRVAGDAFVFPFPLEADKVWGGSYVTERGQWLSGGCGGL